MKRFDIFVTQTGSSTYEISIRPEQFRGDAPPTSTLQNRDQLDAALELLGLGGTEALAIIDGLTRRNEAAAFAHDVPDEALGAFGWPQPSDAD